MRLWNLIFRDRDNYLISPIELICCQKFGPCIQISCSIWCICLDLYNQRTHYWLVIIPKCDFDDWVNRKSL